MPLLPEPGSQAVDVPTDSPIDGHTGDEHASREEARQGSGVGAGHRAEEIRGGAQRLELQQDTHLWLFTAPRLSSKATVSGKG